jgi:hypothetical protein
MQTLTLTLTAGSLAPVNLLVDEIAPASLFPDA